MTFGEQPGHLWQRGSGGCWAPGRLPQLDFLHGGDSTQRHWKERRAPLWFMGVYGESETLTFDFNFSRKLFIIRNRRAAWGAGSKWRSPNLFRYNQLFEFSSSGCLFPTRRLLIPSGFYIFLEGLSAFSWSLTHFSFMADVAVHRAKATERMLAIQKFLWWRGAWK